MLEESNIRPASISACSADALIGALLSQRSRLLGKWSGKLGPKLDVTPEFEIPPPVRDINDDLARAEAFGDERMAGFYARVGKTAGKRVFLSYSHDDSDWHQRFKTHVSPLVERGGLQLWDDTNIGTGTRWSDAIERALETSQAAILLVSANFLASTYLMERELPYLSEAARQRGLILMWLLVSDCLFRETALADYQCLNNPEVPLDQLSPGDREKALANTARLIKRDLGMPGVPDSKRRASLLVVVRNELQRHAVVAVAQAGRFGTVLENVTVVPTAL